jgi:8-oxo-dGTP pyrophosphatase MutT (NUDIX family)
MPDHSPSAPGEVLRHFTVAVFVVRATSDPEPEPESPPGSESRTILLHYHRKLGKWLPPGGHIEDNELPDEAALREVLEETGIHVQLVGGHGLPVDSPRQLALPAGIQVEHIYPGHEHIDLVYFAVPEQDDPSSASIDPHLAEIDQVAWYAASDLAALGASDEIQAWVRRALDEISTTC